MKIIVFSVLIVATIGLLIPGALAAYPDPDKDPKEYLIRYYTEPKYKEWFDGQFPDYTIEERIGYPNKIITDDYYVSPFGFVIEPPKGWIIEDSPDSVADAQGNISAGLVGFNHPRDYDCSEEYGSHVMVWYGDDSKEYDWDSQGITSWTDYETYGNGLLWYLGESMIYDEQTNLKITNESLTKLSNDKFIVRYDFTDVNIMPADTKPGTDGKICPELNVTLKNSMVYFLEPKGEYFLFIYSGDTHYYDADIDEVNKMFKTFYTGETELLSDIMGVPKPEPQPKPITPEPKAIVVEPAEIIEEKIIEETQPICGEGTVMKDGKCVLKEQRGGGCLIATAAFGSEMAPQVQFLREIRDNTVMSTESGTTFMTGFNQFYYSFSPQIADYERENPVFKEAVKVTLTPLLTSLTLLNYVEIDSEEEMLGYGIGIILLNVGMYFVAPAVLIISLKKKLQK